ncbi:MAG: substrate-binding domain-containing protein [Candidatus Promineifilaceae bacterium]
MSTTSDSFLFEQIAESFRLQIARGDLQPGDRLPSIRETAERWGCTPGTVNRAYGALADEGLVTSYRGGGTRVTDNALTDVPTALFSAKLINQIEALFLSLLSQGYSESQVEEAFEIALSRWHTLQLRPELSEESRAGELRFVGSHDLALEFLARELALQTGFNLSLSFRGSLGGLIALARGEADIAGTHLWDEQTQSYNIPYVRRVLPGQHVALVTLAGRSFGLMTNPKQRHSLHSLDELSDGNVRWVNRQSGSGTRVWLDGQLRHRGIDVNTIPGYDDTRATHVEVAQAIRNGTAEAGLGIQAAARAFDLNFVPLAEETYQLVVPERIFGSPAFQALLAIVRSKSVVAALENMGGYQTATTGEVTWIE